MRRIETVWLWKAYFTRGHANYFMMIITMWNFIVIQFELLWREVLENYGIYISIIDFSAMLVLSYFPIAALIGRYDYRHPTGAVKVEQELMMEVSPIYKKIYKNQEEIQENQEVLNNKLDEIRVMLKSGD